MRLCTEVVQRYSSTCLTAQSGSRGMALLFHEHGTRRGEGSASRPGRSLPPGKTRYPLCRKLGGPQGRSGQVRKISPPPGFDSRTVNPVASRYTDCATRHTYGLYHRRIEVRFPVDIRSFSFAAQVPGPLWCTTIQSIPVVHRSGREAYIFHLGLCSIMYGCIPPLSCAFVA
jgi:hypothetical protein